MWQLIYSEIPIFSILKFLKLGILSTKSHFPPFCSTLTFSPSFIALPVRVPLSGSKNQDSTVHLFKNVSHLLMNADRCCKDLNTERSYKMQGHTPLRHFVGSLCNGGKSE